MMWKQFVAAALVAALSGASALAHPTTPKKKRVAPRVEFRLASQDYEADWVEVPYARGRVRTTLFVAPEPVLTGDHVANVSVAEDPRDPSVELDFTEEGARRLAEATEAAVGYQMAIMVDGKVVSAPVLMAPILDGRARVACSDRPSADLLARALVGR